jgi:2-dehydro-3-deoxygluconokinase
VTTRSQARVVTIGEILLQSSTPDGIRFAASRTLDATFGRGEANVAMSLARSGIPAARAGALPRDDLGEVAPSAVGASGLPAGHANGFHDAFQALFGSVLERDVA